MRATGRGRGDAIRLAATCAVALGALTLSAPARSAEPMRVRVVSYNVWAVPYISTERPERMVEIGHRLGALEADLVALQEVWLGEDASRVGEPLASAGLIHQRHFGPGKGDEKGSGLWIASRFPIEQQRFERFIVGRKPYIHWHVDWMATKGVAVVQVRTPGGPLLFANTHLQSTYAIGDYAFVLLSQSLQAADALTMTGGLDEQSPAALPVVVAGDFNATPQSLPLRLLLARSGLRPAASDFDIDAILARSGSARAVAPERVERLWRDRVTFRSGIKRTLSDHPCLVADYRLRPCDRCPSGEAARRLPELAEEAVRSVDDDIRRTERFMWLSRTLCLALPSVALALGWRARRRKRARAASAVAVTIVATLLIVGGWLCYVGWSYAPYKLDILASLRTQIEALR